MARLLFAGLTTWCALSFLVHTVSAQDTDKTNSVAAEEDGGTKGDTVAVVAAPAAQATSLDGVVIASCAPCKAKKNPCSPCAGKNPCNPCAAKNPCNPCNPCAAKKKNPCNPCNPCAAKKS